MESILLEPDKVESISYHSFQSLDLGGRGWNDY